MSGEGQQGTDTVHACLACPEQFASGPQLGGHVATAHRNAYPTSGKWRPKNVFPTPAEDAAMASVSTRRAEGLKRSTDTWPGRP